MLADSERFNRTMSLHWYEWQQGPDPSPSARYRFDTHYPDYLPARGGDEFSTVVKELQAGGVNIMPYINGRIFDQASVSYLRDDGGQYCCLQAIPKFGATELSLYDESYGSGSTFHPADPTTKYAAPPASACSPDTPSSFLQVLAGILGEDGCGVG